MSKRRALKMLNDMQENTATPMPSHVNSSASEEPKTSSGSTRLTREEARKMLAEYEEIGRKFVEYLEANNLLPKPCPAPKLR